MGLANLLIQFVSDFLNGLSCRISFGSFNTSINKLKYSPHRAIICRKFIRQHDSFYNSSSINLCLLSMLRFNLHLKFNIPRHQFRRFRVGTWWNQFDLFLIWNRQLNFGNCRIITACDQCPKLMASRVRQTGIRPRISVCFI